MEAAFVLFFALQKLVAFGNKRYWKGTLNDLLRYTLSTFVTSFCSLYTES